MTAQAPTTIGTLLEQLHGHSYFRPGPGPLRERLCEALAATMKEEELGRLEDPALDLEVSVGRHEGADEIWLGARASLSGAAYSAELALEVLAEPALQDLTRYLAELLQAAPAPQVAEPGKAPQHPKLEGDYHEQAAAAARLKVTPQWLKSVVPCTEYTYEEIEGKKYIRDYYWSKELIERLFRIKSSKTTPEDLQYVASECCEGDQEWARDLIARLKSPQRAEHPPREQGAKGQGHQAQQGHAKGGANPAQAQGQGQGQQKQGEKNRRSRHRRGRDGNKRGQQGAPGPKPPQQ
ncbi:hypothetical protein GMST_38760 [Geomonas silvestris]|uniref:Uncharacterized protein n=1 Tax=Geomonas silvestris TaxID=2740184 RepID=A0A6V8MNJ0_9BACT|nr:hypothetical protein [Geomonas silvestris]GFO61551.1 hypothetical protein GMST_38760 [Geomonas silvestris]